MKVCFWGCRGSLPRSRPDMIRYGGNTPCVQVTSAGGTLLALDMGSGAQDMGQDILDRGEHREGAVLVTHTHWDHIQGFPFFSPLFRKGSHWEVYGPRGLGASLRETLAGQMQSTYFPITLETMAADIRYHDLVEGAFEVGDIRIQTQYLNHTALTLGYRLEADGVTVVYATDHEPFEARLGVEGFQASSREDERHRAFVAGADLLIHDAQYTAEEFPAKQGWGHSSIEYVVDLALAGEVRRLALFHHDQMRTDEALDRLVEGARERVRQAGGRLEVFAAADRQTLDLQAAPKPVAAPVHVSAAAISPPADREKAVLLAPGEAKIFLELAQELRHDGIQVLTAANAEAVRRIAREVRPSLLCIEQDLPGGGALELGRRIREESDWGREVPLVIVAPQAADVDEAAGTAHGVTDWLPMPFSTAYARARIHAWLLRAACRWQPASPPADEPARLAALRSSGLLDTPQEERFDRLTRIAAELFDVPIALVSLVDENRQWFKSHHGVAARETPRDRAFCAHAIQGSEVMVVPDALQDQRFADNPLVTGEPHVRFYAGCPLVVEGGSRIGVLCLIDHRARELDEEKIKLLRDLARLVEREIAESSPGGNAIGRGVH